MSASGQSRRFGIGRESACLPLPDIDVPLADSQRPAIRLTAVMEYRSELPRSLRLDAGRLDHLGPFLGFVGNELAKIGGRARECRAAEVGEPCFHVRICEGRVDLFV